MTITAYQSLKIKLLSYLQQTRRELQEYPKSSILTVERLKKMEKITKAIEDLYNDIYFEQDTTGWKD